MLEKNEADLFGSGHDPEEPSYLLEDILREFGSHASVAETEPEISSEEPEPPLQEPEVSADEPEVPLREPEASAEGPAREEIPQNADSPSDEAPVGVLSFDPSVFSETIRAEQEEQRAKNALSLRARIAQRLQVRRNKKQQKEEEKRQRQTDAAIARAAEREEEDRKKVPFSESFSEERQRYTAMRRLFRLSLLPSCGALALVLFSFFSLISPSFYTVTSLGLVFLSLFIGVPVVRHALHKLTEKTFSADLFVLLTAAVDLADGFLSLFGIGTAHEPVTALACFGISAALAAKMLYARARRDSLFLLSREKATYDSVLLRDDLIVRRKGYAAGFTRLLYAPDSAERWNGTLLPVIAISIPVFALLASFAHGRWADFSFFLSILFTASSLLFLPLTVAAPYAKIGRRLLHDGVALAGFSGAELLSRSRRITVTDHDLFPENSIRQNGRRLIAAESLGRALTCAASLALASGSGLADSFCRELKDEGGLTHPVEQFTFSEHGGFSGVIRGETVSLGGKNYIQHFKHLETPEKDIPGGREAENMLFLLIDRTLVAVFALKYIVPDTVRWAVDALRRLRFTLVLAVRDPVLTVKRFQSCFGKKVRVVYPPLKERLALSAADVPERGEMGAFLFRSGLKPYAESLIASRRLLLTVRLLNLLALGGSAASVLLFFYLLFTAGLSAVSPLRLVLHQLFFALAGSLLTERVSRYRD